MPQNRSEGIDLRCQVDAKPKSSVFRWLFNSSETRFEIPSAESVMSFGNYKVREREAATCFKIIVASEM